MASAKACECVFCGMQKEQVDSLGNVFVHQDPDLFVIDDGQPHATHHMLVIPKEHVSGGNKLTAEHVPMLVAMGNMGIEQLRARLSVQGEEFIEHELRLGLHWPPLQSIEHLHLHVLYPVSSMSWLYSNMVFRPSYFFRKTDRVVMDLLKE